MKRCYVPSCCFGEGGALDEGRLSPGLAGVGVGDSWGGVLCGAHCDKVFVSTGNDGADGMLFVGGDWVEVLYNRKASTSLSSKRKRFESQNVSSFTTPRKNSRTNGTQFLT